MHVTSTRSEISTQARTKNRINSVPTSQSFDLGTYRAALLFCCFQMLWHHVIVIPSECWDESPWPHPTAIARYPRCLLPMSNPTKCRKLGLIKIFGWNRQRASRDSRQSLENKSRARLFHPSNILLDIGYICPKHSWVHSYSLQVFRTQVFSASYLTIGTFIFVNLYTPTQ
jgi:hypothetical protein